MAHSTLLDSLPIFSDLTTAQRLDWNARAERQTLASGEVLCYPGDPVEWLVVLVDGACVDGAGAAITAPALLDAVAVLGGLPHAQKLVAAADCMLLQWPINRLWADSAWRDAARRWLAQSLVTAHGRLTDLDAPRVFDERAQLPPGPFLFEDATILFAFCEANLDALRAELPDGLRIFRRPGRRRDALLVAFAHFPRAFPEDDPAGLFGYTETTVFVPVRSGVRLGLYVPYIYPSTYDPILLGREIYGFPKQLGATALESRQATLAVNDAAQAELRWQALHASDEPRLVRALMDWLGLEGWTLSLAFQAGDALRRIMQFPPFRRVSVFNHKRILDVGARFDAPTFAVDQVTQAVFGVLRWYQIARLDDPALRITAGPLAAWDVTLREAYRTQLDMRLSRGKVVRDAGRAMPTNKEEDL